VQPDLFLSDFYFFVFEILELWSIQVGINSYPANVEYSVSS